VTVDRGTPRSLAAIVKLRRSTTRVKTRIASNRSIGLFAVSGLYCQISHNYPAIGSI
jgi:hypothetical protein